MKRILFLFDKYLSSILTNLTSILLILVTIIVFIQVIYRYVLEMPIGGLGELPTYLMILCVWMGAALNFRMDTHITIKVVDLIIKNQKYCHYHKLVIRVINLFTIFIFSYLSWGYLQYSKQSGDITPGLNFPHWYIVSIVFVSSLLMLFYTIQNFSKEIKELKEVSK